MDANSSAPHVPTASTNEEPLAVNVTVVEDHHSILHAETHENLTEVAAAVNASLHQLEHLRDSITELTNDSLLYGSHIPTLNLNLGPPHAAIVLSDATTDMINDPPPVPEIPTRRSSVPNDIMERLMEYEASIRPRMVVGMDTPSNPHTRLSSQRPSTDSLPAVAAPAQSNGISRAAPTSRPPPYPDLVIPPPRRRWLESSSSRHPDTNSDDGSTILGRRVAARAATGGTNPLGSAASQLERIFLSRTVEIARELQGMTSLLRSRGTELLERSQARMGVIGSSRSINSNSDVNGSGIGRAVGIEGRVSTQMPTVRPTRLRRFRTQVPNEVEPGVPEHTDSTLSHPSVRSIASTLDVQLNRVLSANGADGADGRTYLTRRRLNADGEEEVHNIRLSNLVGDEMEWPMRSIPPMNLAAQGQPETRSRNLPSAVLRNIPPPLPPMGTYTGPRYSRVNPSHTSTNQSRSFESTTRTRRLDWGMYHYLLCWYIFINTVFHRANAGR
jgi:hypothetical protein